jgi:hypothetical protein
MAAAPPQIIGTAPDAFDGNLAKAEPFWNALENYSAGQQKSTNFVAREIDFLRANGPRNRSQGG